jgi:hypothetical protein
VLRAVPNSWFFWDFTILDDERVIGTIDLAWVREAGELSLDGATYRVYRDGLLGGAFVLEEEGRVLARAEKTSALTRAFDVEYNRRSYRLRAESALRRRFVLYRDDREIGSVRPEHAFTYRAIIDLPGEIALPAKIFMTWLAIILWKRDAEASASACAG